MDQPNPSLLEHAFRVEDHVVSVLMTRLKKADVDPQHIGQIAKRVLTIAHQALSRTELDDLLQQASQEFPELAVVSLQEQLYIKQQADMIIKVTIEELVQQSKTEEALLLARQINQGQLPIDLQQKLQDI